MDGKHYVFIYQQHIHFCMSSSMYSSVSAIEKYRTFVLKDNIYIIAFIAFSHITILYYEM